MKGYVTISRLQGGGDSQRIRITVTDDSSRTQFLELHISLEAFSLALTGLAEQDCAFVFRPDLVGKRREHKEELVPLSGERPFQESERMAYAQEVLALYEVDGWKAHTSDLFNGHRRQGDCQRVSFVRHVEETDH